MARMKTLEEHGKRLSHLPQLQRLVPSLGTQHVEKVTQHSFSEATKAPFEIPIGEQSNLCAQHSNQALAALQLYTEYRHKTVQTSASLRLNHPAASHL